MTNKLIRRLAAGWLLCVAGMVHAAYPDRPIQLVVPFAAGSVADVVARLLAEQLTNRLQTTVVVQNVAGAGGTTAVGQVANAAPDGYTLVLAGDAAIVVTPGIQANLPYDPQRDLAPVSQIVVTPNVLVVGNDVPARSVAELVELARAQPGKLSFASAGVGTSSHRAGEMLKRSAKLDLIHVPYKNSPLPDVVGASVTLFFAPTVTGLPLARDGKLRALAVTSPARLSGAPDVPTMAEAGVPDFEVQAWFGLLAPKGTPPEIVQRLHAAAAAALQQPAVRERLTTLGAQPVGSTPDAFRALIASELPRWSRLMREAGIKAE